MRLKPSNQNVDLSNVVNNISNQYVDTVKTLEDNKRLKQENNKLKSIDINRNYGAPFGVNLHSKIYAGEKVTPQSAFGLDVVYACIRDKSESIGQLPVIVKRNGIKLTRGKRDHRILARKPNSYMTMQDMFEMYVTSMESLGNFYVHVERNKYGSISELIPLRYQSNVVTQMDQYGDVYHTYVSNDNKPHVVFSGGDLLHFKLNSTDGLTGLSPITTAAATYGIAIAQETHLGALMQNSAMPRGILYTDQVFDDTNAKNRLREEWAEVSGAKNSGKTPVLEHGLKYMAMGLSPADSELIKQRVFSRLQICSIFRVPAQRIGIIEDQKFKSLEETNRSYMRDSLIPLIVRWENGINDVLPEELEIKVDTDQFSRGDRASQVKAFKDEFSTGAISMGEMREGLGRDRIPGDDVHAIDTNNFTFGKLTDISKLQEQNRLLAQQSAAKPSPEEPDENDNEEGDDDD